MTNSTLSMKIIIIELTNKNQTVINTIELTGSKQLSWSAENNRSTREHHDPCTEYRVFFSHPSSEGIVLLMDTPI